MRERTKDAYMGFEVFILFPEDWAAMEKHRPPTPFHYLQRITEYNDWEKILADYLRKKK